MELQNTLQVLTGQRQQVSEKVGGNSWSKLSTNQSFQFWTKRNKLGKSQAPKYTPQANPDERINAPLLRSAPQAGIRM